MTIHPDDLIATYRDLTPGERRKIDTHLAGCAECRARLAAYQRQDAALESIPSISPRRRLRPRQMSLPRRAFAGLGNAMALGGLAALLWLFSLQVQAANQGLLAGNGTGTAGAVITEPGISIPPTSVRAPSPWLEALAWIAAALLLVGVLFILSRRSLLPTVAGAMLSALLLVSFVPPLSALPNPAALYWRVAGGYSYDPHLPFKNSFLIAGRPEEQIEPYLDKLIGEVGLSPLDPVQSLARYEILRVSLHPRKGRTALVTTRFIYADGSSRIYPVPLLGPAIDVWGFLLAGWRADGLQRLRSEHLALAGQPFAGPGSPILLGPARRLDLHPAANRLDEVNPGHWLWSSVRVQRLVWAPDGRAFLTAMESDSAARQLWLVPLDGSPPRPIGPPGDIRQYGWSPDGRTIVYTLLDADALAVDSGRPYAIMAASPGRRDKIFTLATALESDRLPGLTVEGAWFFSGDSLWLAPYNGNPAILLLPNLPARQMASSPRPAPDGLRLAYSCGSDLCVLDRDGGHPAQRESLEASEIAWSPDGSRLAVIDRDPNNLRPVRLAILSRDGKELLIREIAPGEATEAPQWTPDGSAVFVQTYPQDGRRIIAVDLASSQVLDLSQEHWDAYFALSPDGETLLLNNGRGDFWLADVLPRT